MLIKVYQGLMKPLSYIGQTISVLTFWKSASQNFYSDLRFMSCFLIVNAIDFS